MGDRMRDVTLDTAEELPASEREAIADGLLAHNAARGFPWASRPLEVAARGPAGEVVGGLLGKTNLGWLFVSALWVAERERGRGVGGALLDAAEAEAGRRGCVGVYLDTYSFQARPFYERRGYRLFGELPDCPRGATKYYLSKRLAVRPPTEA
jgi:GNAT superfamily N-acetyltransferase